MQNHHILIQQERKDSNPVKRLWRPRALPGAHSFDDKLPPGWHINPRRLHAVHLAQLLLCSLEPDASRTVSLSCGLDVESDL